MLQQTDIIEDLLGDYTEKLEKKVNKFVEESKVRFFNQISRNLKNFPEHSKSSTMMKMNTLMLMMPQMKKILIVNLQTIIFQKMSLRNAIKKLKETGSFITIELNLKFLISVDTTYFNI